MGAGEALCSDYKLYTKLFNQIKRRVCCQRNLRIGLYLLLERLKVKETAIFVSVDLSVRHLEAELVLVCSHLLEDLLGDGGVFSVEG